MLFWKCAIWNGKLRIDEFSLSVDAFYLLLDLKIFYVNPFHSCAVYFNDLGNAKEFFWSKMNCFNVLSSTLTKMSKAR